MDAGPYNEGYHDKPVIKREPKPFAKSFEVVEKPASLF